MTAEVEVVQDDQGRWRWVVVVGNYRTAPSTDCYDDRDLAVQAASRLDFSGSVAAPG
jgi:uncharacterized protein YegP (UPF0339 family)